MAEPPSTCYHWPADPGSRSSAKTADLQRAAKLQKRWSEVEIDLEVQAAYANLLDGLRELQMDKGRDGDKEPFPIRLTPEAKTAWVHF
jgi:hypothetical protein